MYTEILDRKIFIYSRGERYFKTPKKRRKIFKGKEIHKFFNVWVITDSLNFRKIDTLEYAYPFLPLPIKRAFPPF